MINDIRNLSAKIWDLIYQGVEAITFGNEQIKYNKESKELFHNTFVKMYENLANEYMADADEPLDRHKVAAITIVSAIKANVITSNKNDEGIIFWGNYTLATDSAFVYMLSEMNKRLSEKGEKQVTGYFFPHAMACETDYYKIFYRNLYFANNNDEWGLNPLDIAERLFLLEYMTLEKNGIDPNILKEY